VDEIRGNPASGDANITEIGYNGFLHDAVVDDLLGAFRRVGAKAEKNITVVGIPGIPSIPDIIALPVGAKLPIVIEVKTGANPPYTKNQQYVYPLICVGSHVASSDPRMPSLGLSVGEPFPPLKVYEFWIPGPGQPLYTKDVCEFLGLGP